ncbi:MAG: hypothetical protein ACFHX7_24480 [Pseudomonadota bacterium]
MTPREFSSGNTRRVGSITKKGVLACASCSSTGLDPR